MKKKTLGKGTAFRNNYLTATIILLLLSFSGFAQYDSTKNKQPVNGYGFTWKNGTFNSQLGGPTDTVKLSRADSGSYAMKNSIAYLWTGYYWKAIGGSVSGTSTPYSYQFSATAPTDTTKGWIDSRYNIYNTYPVHYRVNGAWSATDTIGGVFWDNIGKTMTRGKPYVIIATGQSNLGGSYIGEAINPNLAPFYGYYGDTIPAPSVAAWNNNTSKWVIGKIRDTPFQYSSGANYLLLAAKRITERTGRSVRIVTYPQGGTGLQCWSGVTGTPPQDSACYNEFKSRVQASGVMHPDVFIWAQSEAGITPNPTSLTYFNKWKEMVDSMIHRDHLMDSTTLKILMGSGTPGAGDGDVSLRRLAASSDRTIKYIDNAKYQTVLTDGVHFTPKGHEELAIRLINSIEEGQKNPARDMMGSDTPSLWKPSSVDQKLIATGLNLVRDNDFKPYIRLGSASNDNKTIYTGAEPNGSNQFAPGLVFDPISGETVSLKGYAGIGLTIDATRIVFNAKTATSAEVEVYSGADPQFSLHDLTLNKEWKLRMNNGTNTFTWYYDGTRRFDFTKEGHLGLGLSGAQVSDSMLRVKEGTLLERGLNLPGIPSSNNADDSMLVKNMSSGTVGFRPIPSVGFSPWAASGSDIYFNTGNVGIGTPPSVALDVMGDGHFGQGGIYSAGGLLGTDWTNGVTGVGDWLGIGNGTSLIVSDALQSFEFNGAIGGYNYHVGDMTVDSNIIALGNLKGAGFKQSYTKVTSFPYTVLLSDYTISVDNGASSVDVTLPDATTCAGQIFVIKRYDDTSTGSLTVSATAGNVQNKSGVFGSTSTIAVWNAATNDKITFQSNGTDWEYIQ